MRAIYHRHALLPALLLCLAGAATATDIYKYRMPDGTTLYTQASSESGRLAKVMRFPAIDQRQAEAERAAQQRLDQEIARADRLAEQRSLRQMIAEWNLCSTGAAFELATHTFESGLAPGPGERQGIAGGGSRLNAAYWDRIERMRLQVEALREQLYRATREYDAVK